MRWFDLSATSHGVGVQSEGGVLVVAGEDLWPVRSGGQERTAAVAEALAKRHRVVVAIPEGALRKRSGRPLETFPYRRQAPARYRGFASARPRLGRAVLQEQGIADLMQIAVRNQFAALLFAHSYLAAMLPASVQMPVIVDFANLEARRLSSLARAAEGVHAISAGVEAVKAGWWEPRVARRASAVLAVTERDGTELRRWGARRAFTVANVVESPSRSFFSPATGYALFLGSGGYGPNDSAIARLLFRIWPRVTAGHPSARLRIVGRGTERHAATARSVEGVEVIGEVDDLDEHVAGAALVVAPVDSGGGSQLKIARALAHRRVVVASPYSAAAIPAAFAGGYVIADDDAVFANIVGALLGDTGRRHELERRLRSVAPASWSTEVAPLLEWLESGSET